jgi:hypothetical protein
VSRLLRIDCNWVLSCRAPGSCDRQSRAVSGSRCWLLCDRLYAPLRRQRVVAMVGSSSPKGQTCRARDPCWRASRFSQPVAVKCSKVVMLIGAMPKRTGLSSEVGCPTGCQLLRPTSERSTTSIQIGVLSAFRYKQVGARLRRRVVFRASSRPRQAFASGNSHQTSSNGRAFSDAVICLYSE